MRVLTLLTLLTASYLLGGPALASPPVMSDLPATVAELQAAAADYPELRNWASNSETLTSGLQTMLLDEPPPRVPLPEARWAPRLPGPPLRALVVSTLGQEADLAYLLEALPLELTLISAPAQYMYDYLGAPEALDFIVNRLEARLDADYDVILLSFSAATLPERLRERLLDKVRAGTGLVLSGLGYYGWHGTWWSQAFPGVDPYAGTGGRHRLLVEQGVSTDHPLLSGLPWGVLPPLSMYAGARLPEGSSPLWTGPGDYPLAGWRQEGRGRVVGLGWLGLLGSVGRYTNVPEAELDFFSGIRHFERWLASATAKAVLFAAGREPAVALTLPDTHPLPAAQPASLTLPVTGDAALARTVEVTLRDLNFNTLAERAYPVRNNAVSVDLPALAAGRHVLDAVLLDRGGAAHFWGSTVVLAESPARLEAALPREFYRPEETATVQGRVLDAPPGAHTLRLEVRDNAGGLLDRAEVTPDAGGAFRWDYSVIPTRFGPQTVTLTLLVGGRPLVQDTLRLSCVSFDWFNYHNVVWGTSYTPYAGLRQGPALRRALGFDAAITAGHAMHEAGARLAVESGLLPFWTNWFCFHPGQLETDYAQTLEFFDARVPDSHTWINRYGAIGICVQDERHQMSDPGSAAPEVLARFRDWLRQRYPSIAALNAAWETRFASFDEVEPLRTQAFSKDQYNLAPWLEYRLFFSELTVDVDRRYRDLCLEGLLDRDVYYGIEGLFGLSGHLVPFAGFDYARHAQVFNLLMPYGRPEAVIARSFCDGPILTWAGYGQNPEEYFTTPWWGLLHGYYGMGWFCGSTFMHEFGALYPQAAWVRETMRPLQEGVGQLIHGAQEQVDPVVFLYSQPSIYARRPLGMWINPDNRHLMERPSNASRHSLQALFTEAGFNYRYLSEEQVQRGALEGRKLLVLSSCFALAPETCRAIEQWVSQGGTVLADLRPAVFDHRGVPQGGLDDLFGVRADRFEWQSMPFDYLVWARGDIPEFRLQSWLVGEYYERGLEVTDGHACGEHIFTEGGVNAPAFIFKQTGQGRALLMNFLETAYIRNPEHWQRRMVAEFVRMAGLTPELQLFDPSGAALWSHEIVRFQRDNAEYVGVFRMETASGQTSPEVLLPFPDAAHTYLFAGVDPIARRALDSTYLGHTDRAAFRLTHGGVALLARLPYRLTGLRAQADRVARLREGTRLSVQVLTEGNVRPGTHVVHARVLNPAGEEELDLSTNLELRAGRGVLTLPIRLDAPSGEWRVELREVVSGEQATVRFRLR